MQYTVIDRLGWQVSRVGIGTMPFGFPHAVYVFPGLFCLATLVALGFDRRLRTFLTQLRNNPYGRIEPGG